MIIKFTNISADTMTSGKRNLTLSDAITRDTVQVHPLMSSSFHLIDDIFENFVKHLYTNEWYTNATIDSNFIDICLANLSLSKSRNHNGNIKNYFPTPTIDDDGKEIIDIHLTSSHVRGRNKYGKADREFYGY